MFMHFVKHLHPFELLPCCCVVFVNGLVVHEGVALVGIDQHLDLLLLRQYVVQRIADLRLRYQRIQSLHIELQHFDVLFQLLDVVAELLAV